MTKERIAELSELFEKTKMFRWTDHTGVYKPLVEALPETLDEIERLRAALEKIKDSDLWKIAQIELIEIARNALTPKKDCKHKPKNIWGNEDGAPTLSFACKFCGIKLDGDILKEAWGNALNNNQGENK